MLDFGYMYKEQEQFFMSKNRYKAFVAGFGAGKTHVFLMQTLYSLIKARNKRNKSKGWIIYPNLKLASELFVTPFSEILESTAIPYKFNKSLNQFDTYFGTINIYTLERPDTMVGSELTFCGADEFDVGRYDNCSRALKKIQGRLRGARKAQFYIVTTPEGFKVTYEKFKKDPLKNSFLVQADSRNNKYLSQEYIDDLSANYDQQTLDMYMKGLFVPMGGLRAYHSFDRAKCVPEYKNLSRQVHIGIDFNVDPMTAVVAERLPADNFYGFKYKIFKEYYIKNANTKELIMRIKEDFYNCQVVVYPDSTGISRKTSADYSDIQLLQKEGFEVVYSHNPTQKERIKCVNRAIEKNLIEVSENLDELIADLEQVQTDRYGFLDKTQEKNGRVHISDALGYLVVRNFPLRDFRVAHGAY